MENKDLTELEKTYEALAIKMGFIVFKTEGLAQLWAGDEDDGKTKTVMVINWRNTEGIEQFLKTASAINARVLYLDAVRFSWNELSNKIDNLYSLSDEEMSKRHKEAEEFRRFDGLTGHLILAFILNNIWHTFQKTTDWLPKYLRLLVESEDFEEEEEEEEEVLEEEDLEKYARKLANNPGFAKLKNKSDQIALARKVFCKEDEKVLYYLKDVVERARVIFQTEVK